MNEEHPMTPDELRAALRAKSTVLLRLAAMHGIDTQSFIVLVAAQHAFNERVAQNALDTARDDAERANVERNIALRNTAYETGTAIAEEAIERKRPADNAYTGSLS